MFIFKGIESIKFRLFRVIMQKNNNLGKIKAKSINLQVVLSV